MFDIQTYKKQSNKTVLGTGSHNWHTAFAGCTKTMTIRVNNLRVFSIFKCVLVQLFGCIFAPRTLLVQFKEIVAKKNI